VHLDALVFDFDGVIIDTESARFRVWSNIFALHGQILPREQWVKNIGRSEYVIHPYELLEQMTGELVDKEKIRALEKQLENEYIQNEPLMCGVFDRINEAVAADTRLGIVSSASRRYVEHHLRERGIFQLFDVLVCRDDVAIHKPHPLPYLKAIEVLGADHRCSCAFEDSPIGVESAVSAGLYCIAIAGKMTKELDLSKANLIINSFADITYKLLLERMNKIEFTK
jgi:HAD superfamily hydrolase (TIGR01509 family)